VFPKYFKGKFSRKIFKARVRRAIFSKRKYLAKQGGRPLEGTSHQGNTADFSVI
jgi:hypothetical protein